MSRRRSRVERGTRCSLFRNGGEFRPGGGKVLYIRDGMTIAELHNIASRQLDGHAVRRCFSAHGIEVDDPMMVEEDGILFCSDSSDENAPDALAFFRLACTCIKRKPKKVRACANFPQKTY